jgi:hypothetical protein
MSDKEAAGPTSPAFLFLDDPRSPYFPPRISPNPVIPPAATTLNFWVEQRFSAAVQAFKQQARL